MTEPLAKTAQPRPLIDGLGLLFSLSLTVSCAAWLAGAFEDANHGDLKRFVLHGLGAILTGWWFARGYLKDLASARHIAFMEGQYAQLQVCTAQLKSDAQRLMLATESVVGRG